MNSSDVPVLVENLKYYRNAGDVHAFDVNTFDVAQLSSDFIAMTEDEIDRHLHPSNYLTDEQKDAMLPKLTRRQFRLVLVKNAYALADIESLIASIEDPLQRQIIQIEWEDSTVFERTSESLLTMAGMLGLSRDRINELWQEALLL